MKLATNRAIRVSETTVTAGIDSIGSLPALNSAIRETEEDAAIDAEGFPAQAEEANAPDPVG